VLAVIEDQQRLRLAELGAKAFQRRTLRGRGQPERGGSRRRHQRRVAQASQLHQPGAVGACAQPRRRSLKSQARLPRPAGAGEREQAITVKQPRDLSQLPVAPDEARQWFSPHLFDRCLANDLIARPGLPMPTATRIVLRMESPGRGVEHYRFRDDRVMRAQPCAAAFHAQGSPRDRKKCPHRVDERVPRAPSDDTFHRCCRRTVHKRNGDLRLVGPRRRATASPRLRSPAPRAGERVPCSPRGAGRLCVEARGFSRPERRSG
jgi:hypothetical protein